MSKTTTIIDIGSNSVKMAIFRKTSNFGFHLLYELKSKVRISENSYENNSFIQEKSMDRCLNALRDFKRISKDFKSRKLICVATSAIRDAPNKGEFLKKVRDGVGINVKIIDGKKEAYYGAVACANLLHKKDGLTIDIGGGSTELCIIVDSKIKDLISLNLGSVRLKELFFDSNKIQEASLFIREYLRQNYNFIESIKEYAIKDAFGIGGSIRAYAKYIMQQEKYQFNFLHGYEIDAKKTIKTLEKVIFSTQDELKAEGFDDDRIDSIRPGLLILKIILEEIDMDTLVISGVGIREGVFLSDMLRYSGNKFPKNFNPSVRSLQDCFLSKSYSSKYLQKIIKMVFDIIKDKFDLDSKYLYHLNIAGKIYHIGNKLNFYQAHKHSSYIALNALNYGFSHYDRILIAYLLEYSHKKRAKKIEIIIDNKTTQILSFILALSLVLEKDKDFHICLKDNVLEVATTSFTIKQNLQLVQLPRTSGLELNILMI